MSLPVSQGAAVVLTIALLMSPTQAMADVQSDFDRGMKIVKNRQAIASRAKEAKEAFQAVVDAKPDHSHAWYNLGLLAKRDGDLKKARFAWRQALKGDKRYLPARARLAELDLEAAGNDAQRQGAIAKLEAIVTCPEDTDCEKLDGKNPYQPEARNILAEVAIHEKRWDDAARHARNVLLGDPDNINAYVNLGVSYFRQGLVDQTWLIVSNALDRRPDAAALHNLMGLVYLKKDDSSRATKSFMRALKEDPGLVESKLNLAALELSYGSFDAALKRFDEVIASGTDTPMVALSRAVALRGLQRYDEATSIYERILKANPEMTDVHYNLCVLHQQYTNDWSKAQAHCGTYADGLGRKHPKKREMKRRMESIRATLEAIGPSEDPAPEAPEAPKGAADE